MTRLLHLLRLLCACALMMWVLRQLRWADIAAFDWRSISLTWLLLALMLGGASVLAWAARWWWFVRVYGLRVPFRELLRLTFFADFFNLYFLGPLGADGVRLLRLTQLFPQQRGAIIGSLVLDHIGGLFGGVVLYLTYSDASGLPASVTHSIRALLPWAAGITILGLGVIMEPHVQRIISRTPGLAHLGKLISPIYAGTFRHPWLFSGFLISCLGSACAFAAFWATAKAVGLSTASLPQMLGLMPAVDLLASLPISISGLGVRESLLMQWLGTQPDCDPVRALGTSLLGFAAIGLWGLLGGLWMLLDRRH